tara:strand:- start:329 stop:532 length:204 start_codon:yes stop_codon:yes gene_type:complete
MSIVKKANAQKVVSKKLNGQIYVPNNKFHNFGSVPEDSPFYHTLLAEEADRKRMEIEAQRKIRIGAY